MPVRTIPVTPGPRRLSALADAAGADAVARVQDAAQPLRRLRVVHLTTPPFAPRALDALRSAVPLLRDCGLDVRWLAVAGDDRADAAARAVGDALRGGEAGPPEDERVWRERALDAAAEVPRGTDVVVVHGIEGLALLAGEQAAPAPKRVWCPEGAAPNAPADLVARADEVVELAPAVDPLAPRNAELPLRTAGGLARTVGLSLDRPFVVHCAQADGWSLADDAIATLHAARDAGAEGLQLAIVAMLPAGDPRAWRTLGELTDHAEGTTDVLVVPDVGGAGDAEVNALQRLARVALHDEADQAALDAAWKGTPPATDAARVAALVADPAEAIAEGRAARERVRETGLVTRLLTDLLELYARLS
jgi:trehalose synthase